MVGATITKGSRVEVSSDDDGFKDAWYVATVMEVVEASPMKKKSSNKKNKNRKKIGYFVKYDTLFEEDLSEPLMEIVDSSFVRPLPPRYPRRNNDNEAEEEQEVEESGGVDFELLDVVDAYHLDGWWTGVVTKLIVDGEINKFTVAFESPPEEFEFERSQLRLHLDWIDCRWRLPPKKIMQTQDQESADRNATQTSKSSMQTQDQESADRHATQTSKSSNEAHLGLATPSKGALTADHSDNPTVDVQLSAKRKSRSRKKAETQATTVDAVDGSRAYSGNKRIVDSVEESSRAKRFQRSAGSKGNTQDTESVMEASGSQALHRDSLCLEQETIIIETDEAEDGKSQQKRKRGRPLKLLYGRPNGLLEDNQQAGKRDSSAIAEMPSELDEQPLSMWYQGLQPRTVLKNSRSSRCSTLDHHDEPSDALNPAVVNNGETVEEHQELPFIKRSPIWATIESLELYQKPPQKPHFSPLKKLKEDYREGLAIGHMVTFANVVQRTSMLQLADPNDIIESCLEILVDLESHGFDVGGVRARLNELLSRKAKVGQLEDEFKEVESVLEKRNLERSVIEEEINQLEVKMKELQEKLVWAVTMKNVKDEEIMTLQSNLHLVGDQIVDGKLDFEKLAGSPL